MKKFLKACSYIIATVLVFVISQTSAFAADGNSESSSLTSAQVVGGISILLLAVLIPTIRKERRSVN